MNSPTSRNYRMAITEDKEDAFTFRWNVRNFRERLQNKNSEKGILESPVFTFEVENKNERQLVVDNQKCLGGTAQATKQMRKLDWQLYLQCISIKEWKFLSTKKHTFLSVHLRLMNSKEKEAANYEIDLLDSEGKSLMNLVTDDSKYAPFSSGWGNRKFLRTTDLLDPKKKLLEDNTLKLRCRIIMKGHVYVERQLSPLTEGTKKYVSTNPMVQGTNDPQNKTMIPKKSPDISSMFTSSICTDVLIKTKGSTLKAHKAVLSCRSPVFLAMFQSEMAESIQNVVEIADFEDDIVKWMLEYIYGVEISQEVLTENAAELFQIADKYDIEGLKDFLGEVLALNLSVETVVDTLILADMNAVSNLKANTANFVNMNKEAVITSDEFQKLYKRYKHNPSILMELFA